MNHPCVGGRRDDGIDVSEAIALFEVDGLPTAVLAQDLAHKTARLTVLACAPVSPGKVILILAGAIAEVDAARARVEPVIGSRLLGRLYLPGIDARVIAACGGGGSAVSGALGTFELDSVAACVEAADLAVKGTEVEIVRMHLAAGYGGRSFLLVSGPQSQVEACAVLLERAHGGGLTDQSIVERPTDGLLAGILSRPWPLDPALPLSGRA